jgi:hypothetical protein
VDEPGIVGAALVAGRAAGLIEAPSRKGGGR